MCGIGGYIGIEHQQSPKDLLARMGDDLAHRGPDAVGMHMSDSIGLVHRRLSIIDLSEASNQPFQRNDGEEVLIFNGELYNYLELKSELESSFGFRTQSDTEVVLAALSVWGTAALQKFNGMFALAFWNEPKQELVLARDRVGIKPLYYSEVGNGFVFSSEMRALLNSGLVERRLNSAGLSEFLMYQTVHEPNTIIQGIKMLPAGSFMSISDSEVQMTPYWQPWQSKHDDHDGGVVKNEIKNRFVESVERRMVSDVPFGAFLSGGIDSSLVVGVMAGVLDKKISTFNVSFDEKEYSESQYARQVADKFGTDHHEILLSPDSFLDSLPDALAAIDHPSGDGPNSWIVSRETKRQGITMALSGLGGDELFAGYEVFKQLPTVAEKNWLLSFPKGLRTMVGVGLKTLKPGVRSLKTAELLNLDYFNLEHLYPVFRKSFFPSKVRSLLMDHGEVSDPVNNIVRQLEGFKEFDTLPVLSRISIAEMKTYMQSVLLRDTDQMSMAHALEVRVPFLDHKLIEYVIHVDDHLKYPHTPKKLLVESLGDLLPPELVNRQKMGFVLPWENWMRGPLKPFVRERIEHLKNLSEFNAPALDAICFDFDNLRSNVNWSRIWMLVALSDWLQRHDIK
jgi:asparagine synthase (glutamine-hydrolysing)